MAPSIDRCGGLHQVTEGDLRGRTAQGELIALPKAVICDAPLRASESVGWAWQTRARSSEDAPYSMAKQASPMSSPAMALTMCTPRSLSVCLHAKTFTKPTSSWFALARELAPKVNLPFLYSTPSAFSISSVFPTPATSGCVYTT